MKDEAPHSGAVSEPNLSRKGLKMESTNIQEGRLTLSVDEAAKRLGISRPTAYEGIRRGEIPSIKVGSRILVPIARLEQLLAGAAK